MEDPAAYVATILRGLVRCPDHVTESVDLDCSFLCRKVRVDLRLFDKADRARLVGTAAAVRRLLRSACALRQQHGCLRYFDDHWVLSDEQLRRGMSTPSALPPPPSLNEVKGNFSLKDYLTQILRGLVQCPSRLSVTQPNGVFQIDLDCTAPEDRGRLVGTGGETAFALRRVMSVACDLRHVRCPVRFVGGQGPVGARTETAEGGAT